jgi:hypothetical protein
MLEIMVATDLDNMERPPTPLAKIWTRSPGRHELEVGVKST